MAVNDSELSPVQVNARGAASLLKRGGTLVLYMKKCPHCEAIHGNGPQSEVGRLASAMHKAKIGVTAVANGPRIVKDLDKGVWGHIDSYPTIFMTDRRGNVERYSGERTAEAMLQAYKERVERSNEPPVKPAARVQPEHLETHDQIKQFMKNGDGLIAMLQQDSDASNAWVPSNGQRGMLHDVANHPRVLNAGVSTAYTDGPSLVKAMPELHAESFPAFIIIEGGKEVFVYDGEPRIDSLIDTVAR